MTLKIHRHCAVCMKPSYTYYLCADCQQYKDTDWCKALIKIEAREYYKDCKDMEISFTDAKLDMEGEPLMEEIIS
jgi:hypothetical protein